MWQKPDEDIDASGLLDVVSVVMDDDVRKKMIDTAKAQGEKGLDDENSIFCFSAKAGANMYQIGRYVDEHLLSMHCAALEYGGKDVNFVGIINKSLFGMSIVVRRPCEKPAEKSRER